MRICQWKWQMVLWAWNIAFTAFNAECGTTCTIVIPSPHISCIVSYWNGVWATRPYSSIMYSWAKWANYIKFTIYTRMDNQRDGRLCAIGTATQTYSSVRIIMIIVNKPDKDPQHTHTHTHPRPRPHKTLPFSEIMWFKLLFRMRDKMPYLLI